MKPTSLCPQYYQIIIEVILLVEETHGSSGQCVSFSLIDVRSLPT